MAICKGNKDNHCCWFQGKECQYLEFDTNGREIACGLLLELGDWESVYKDERYIRDVKSKIIASDIGCDCGDWPKVSSGHWCSFCGHGDNPNEGIT